LSSAPSSYRGGLRRIPHEAKVGRIPVGGKELELVNLIDIIQEAIDRKQIKLPKERINEYDHR
jgi:hypothetical protein